MRYETKGFSRTNTNQNEGRMISMKTASVCFLLLLAAPFLVAQEPAAIPQPSAATVRTQSPPQQLQAIAAVSATNNSSADVSAESGLPKESPSANPQLQFSSSPQSKPSGDGSDWHVTIVPYVWFLGLRGTSGPPGTEMSVHESPGDLLSQLRFGLMGTVQARHKRLFLPVDVFWVRLESKKSLPTPLGVISEDMKTREFILAPKVGYFLIDSNKLKATALVGLRYWHLGEGLSLSPPIPGLSFSGSQNFVDPVVGGRIDVDPVPKVEVTVLGDVGGWGTGSKLDYQVVGGLGYKITPRLTLQAGYRYMGVDYRSAGFLFNTIQSGAVVGITIELGKTGSLRRTKHVPNQG